MKYTCNDCKNWYSVNNHKGCALHRTKFKPSECDRFEKNWAFIIGFYMFVCFIIIVPICLILLFLGVI